MTKVSVLIPVYNGEEYVRDAIQSTLDQTYEDFEIIAIDDGSTDNTYQILKEYSKKDPRVKIYKQNNQGLTKTLNKGILLAKGEYIARLDADDYSRSDRLEHQVKFLDNHPEYGMVGSYVTEIYPEETIRVTKPTEDNEIKKSLIKSCIISHSTVMVRRWIIAEEQYNEKFETSQDYDLWIRIGKMHKISILPLFLVFRRKRDNSITNSKKKLQKLKYHTIIKLKAFRYLKLPFKYAIFIIKPLVEFFIPKALIKKYMILRFRKNGKED